MMLTLAKIILSGLLGSLLAAALTALVVRRARTRRGARDEEVGA